ncbi:MAG: deoxyhypusine synthase [Holophaga sp.]|nr:deoxyhypusine synthase [Holophaga sp.]
MEKTSLAKAELLVAPIEHLELKAFDPRPLVDAMGHMAFQARNLNRAARIYGMMLAEPECGVILTLAGSLVSAGLKHVILDLVRNNMVDAIVSTGANIVDQDFFEALGFRHYLGSPALDDNQLRDLAIDRIYDTLIDEDQLRVCDQAIGHIADGLEPRPYSSREFIEAMGRHLQERDLGADSIVRAAFEKGVPIFCPAFSDCSAGFGFVMHQVARPGRCMTLDSARDFLELTRVKLACADTGLLMVGGGVPKNFAQDTVVAAELLGHTAPMHKYAVQLTVADERDGALSGSTLQEASSWGKVSTTHEQMVYGEATITFPLLAGYAYHQGNWAGRRERRLAEVCAKA